MDEDDILDLLRARRRALEAPFLKAQAANDQAEMDRLQGIAGEIDDLLAEGVRASLATLAASLASI